jgi:hypothetical protein
MLLMGVFHLPVQCALHVCSIICSCFVLKWTPARVKSCCYVAAGRADLASGLAATEARLMRRMAGLLIAQGGVIVTLVSLFG